MLVILCVENEKHDLGLCISPQALEEEEELISNIQDF